MNLENTTGLFHTLQNTRTTQQFLEYKKEHIDSIPYNNFADYMNYHLSKHPHLISSQIIKDSGLAREYAVQILNGTRKNPSRDKVIALCFGAKMNLKETQHALEISKNRRLYPKDGRDAALIICLNTNCYNMIDINLFLAKHNFTELQ